MSLTPEPSVLSVGPGSKSSSPGNFGRCSGIDSSAVIPEFLTELVSERWARPTCSKPRNPSFGSPSLGLWWKPLGSKETSPSPPHPPSSFPLRCRAYIFNTERGQGAQRHICVSTQFPFICTNKIRDRQVDTCIYSHPLGQTDIYLLLYK